MRYEQQGNKRAASFLHCCPFRDTDHDRDTELSSKEATDQIGPLAEGVLEVLRCFSFIPSIGFKVPNLRFCDTGSVSTGRCWLMGCEWINPNSHQHTEILSGQASREASAATKPT